MKELRETTLSINYLNAMIDSMIDAVFIVDCDLNIKMVNRAVTRLLGYSRDFLLGKPYDMLCANREGHCENVKMHYEEGSIWDIETYFRTQDGTEIPVLLSASPLKVTNGDTGDILVVVKDNTDYRNALESERQERDRALSCLKITKETEQTILEGQQMLIGEHEKLNELFKTVQQGKREWEKTMDCLGDLILITGEDGKIRRVNRTVSETFNMPYQEIIGRSWEEVLLEQGMESSTFYSGGVEIFQKAAGKWYVLNSYPFTSEDLGYSGAVITLHDTSEIKHVTEKLEETSRTIERDRENLRNALDQISNLIQNVTLRKDYEAATINPNLKRCYEVKGCIKKDCPCYGKEAARCWQIAGTFCGGKVQGAFAQKYGSCSKCNVFTEAMSDPIHQIGEQFNNMMHVLELKNRETENAYAELKATQAQLLQREKMASVGQLAAGVAHEINNPMGFISSNLGTLGKYVTRLTEFINSQSKIMESLQSAEASGKLMELRKRLKLDYILSDLEQLIKESLEGADRVKKIVQNLKSFSRVDEAEYKYADINECIESTMNIVWNELKYKATVAKAYGELPRTKCYPQQLNQVFVNLLINAVQAIEKQGEIKIKSWNGDGSIKVSISDTGAGIAEDKIGRIFEPFFTTKEVGKGTGLGLSITYDIVKKHNGDISVESEVGKGTTFTVRIPVVEEK